MMKKIENKTDSKAIEEMNDIVMKANEFMQKYSIKGLAIYNHDGQLKAGQFFDDELANLLNQKKA